MEQHIPGSSSFPEVTMFFVDQRLKTRTRKYSKQLVATLAAEQLRRLGPILHA